MVMLMWIDRERDMDWRGFCTRFFAILFLSQEFVNSCNKFTRTSAQLTDQRKGRRHGVDWGGHVHPTFARGRF